MPTEYEDINNLNNQVSQLYDKQMQEQQNIINTSTEQAINEIERNKKKAQEEAEKTNRALYTDYQKQINPYGTNAENLYTQGLAKSGLAETTKANYYNTYQTARTEAQTSANQIKADFDNEITKARQTGDLQLAQSALQMYQQKVNDLYNTYNLTYQRGRDTVSDTQWQKQYEQALQQAQWQQAFNQQQFDYQKERDRVADEQWQKEYELSKKAKSSSRTSSGSGSSSNNSLNTGYVQTENGGYVSTIDAQKQILNARLASAENLMNNKTTATMGKNNAREILANAKYSRVIDDDEFRQLANRYNLD